MQSDGKPELDWHLAVRGPRGQSHEGFIERATARTAAGWILQDAQVCLKEPKGPGWVVVCENTGAKQLWAFKTDDAGELDEGVVFTPRR